MTGKSDFTSEEWDLVRAGPPLAGMLALTAEHGGTFRETWALAKAYTDARKQHGESELLDALVNEKPEVTHYKSAEELEQVGLPHLTEAVAVLNRKATPGEVHGYKRFVLDVAERVAEAHKEQGERISPPEREVIEKLAASLNPID